MATKTVSPQLALVRYIQTNKHILSIDKVSIDRKQKLVVVYRSYFYRHGMDSYQFGDRVLNTIDFTLRNHPEVIPGVKTIRFHSHEDSWKTWPKTSYFIARFSLT